MKKWTQAGIVIVVVFVFDQLTKFFISQTITLGDSKEIIPNILYFTHVHNTGSAFSVITNANLLLAIISVIVVGIVSYILYKTSKEEHATILLLSAIIGGACGNLIDRVIVGGVVDFIDIQVWPIFNVADSVLTLSIIGLLWLSYKSK